MSEIKPIETEYKGYRFRSRLEARWAVAFDAMGIKWEYEPEGYDLGGGVYYLPDFYLPEVRTRCGTGLWVEVKGKPTSDDYDKLGLFCGMLAFIDGKIDNVWEREEEYGGISVDASRNRRQRIILVGNPPDDTGDICEQNFAVDGGYYGCFWNFYFVDGDNYTGVLCRHNGEVWFCGADHDQYDNYDLMRIGVTAAKAARFEHGEHGTASRGGRQWMTRLTAR